MAPDSAPAEATDFPEVAPQETEPVPN